MSFSDDLLGLARRLADPGGLGAPRQVDLKRGISTAYYALFHRIVEEATRRLVGRARSRRALRQAVFGRSFDHAGMKDIARGFLAGNPAAAYREAMGSVGIPPAISAAARCFVELQEQRHLADYHAGTRFMRIDVLNFIVRVDQAFRDLCALRGSLEADVFLSAMLLGRKPNR